MAGADAEASSSAGDGGVDPDDAAAELPEGEWTSATANLANMKSECGNLAGLFVKPDEDLLIAGVAQKGLWTSKDGGESWQALGGGPGSAIITNHATSIVYDPSDAKRFWVTGIYGVSGGAYRTADGGKTFVTLGNASHDDLVAIDFMDAERKLLLVGVHEAARGLLRSTDGGSTWNNIAAGLPNISCSFPLIISATTYLVGCSYSGEGIYRSADSGQSWKLVSSAGGTGMPLRASDGAIYWAVKNNGGLVVSEDDGLTWKQATPAGVIVGSVPPIELPDGRLAMISQKTVVISENAGQTWRPASAPLPYQDVSGLVYSAQRRAFFVKHNSCEQSAVPEDAIMRFDFDYAQH